jgi:predicted AAA+ superfamily ATPase
MYIKRKIAGAFQEALSLFPACVLTGARQTGKSTFLRNELNSYRYVTFDDPVTRDFAASDPDGFIKSLGDSAGIILDEIQYVPDLLQYIKMDVDNQRRPGRWILTGSQQFHLMRNVNESLAGRAVLFDLAPFCYPETSGTETLGNLLWTGFYPELALCPEKRELWIRSYIQTYLERDIRQLGNVTDIHSFDTFIKLCAARHGQELNLASIARESGNALVTLKRWISLLESCYLIYLLPPFHNNLGKRVVKSPKIYFMDSALATFLTQQPSAPAMLSGSMGGAFFEGFIVTEAIKCFFNHGKKPDLFFWRSHDGLEVDLIIQIGDKIHPVEIKRSATPKPAFLDPLNRFKMIARNSLHIGEGVLVCQAETSTVLPHGNRCLPWQEFYPWLDRLIGTK